MPGNGEGWPANGALPPVPDARPPGNGANLHGNGANLHGNGENPPGNGENPVILLSLFRALDMRLMLNTGVVPELSHYTRVVLLAPPELLPTLRESLGAGVAYEPLQYGSSKYASGVRTSEPIRRRLESLIRETLRLTYGRPGGHENWTGALHVASYRQTAPSLRARLAREIILALAFAASRSRTLRKSLQAIAARVLRGRLHDPVFARWRPAVLVVCSVGLELDARLILEARRRGVPSLAVVQSWDKTSSKGYPLAVPDRVLVWSDVMASECAGFLDIPPAQVEVAGAPVFDNYFDPANRQAREVFLSSLGLDPSRKAIFCALCSPAYHAGNLDLARLLAAAVAEDRFSAPVSLVLRVHPAYFENAGGGIAGQRRELFGLLDGLGAHASIHVNLPDVAQQETSYVINPADAAFVTNILANCDVSVSVLSTQMVEAALFDRPAVTIEYGHWSSNVLEADLAGFRLEHLERILKTGAVARVRAPGDLVPAIDEALCDPAAQRAERTRLSDQEVSVHRGTAAANTAAAIHGFAATRATTGAAAGTASGAQVL